MKHVLAVLVRIALFAFVCWVFSLAAGARLSSGVNLAVIWAGVLVTFPMVGLARWFLDRHPATGYAVWTTTLVHVGLGMTFGVPIVRAVVTHPDWRGWVLPVPPSIGEALVIGTGAASFLTVMNLAVKGLGAPFFIALSRKLSVDWMYAWTRNPMVLAALAFFLALGVWFRSALFVLWVLVPFTPALLFFIRVYEERELEIRFGASYVEYKSRTPRLWPRKPGG